MPDPAIEQRAAIKTAIDTASTAVAAVDDDATDAQVMAAGAAIAAARKAISDAADVPPEEKAANTGTVNALAGRLTVATDSRTAAMSAADEEERKANSATAKALKKAIDDIVGLTTAPAVTPTSIPAITVGNADATTAITLKKGDSVASLGSWDGTDYAGMEGTGNAKNTGMVRVYANQGASKSVTFASEAGGAVHGWSLATSTASVNDDYTVVTTAAAAQGGVGGFPTTGTTSYDNEDTVAGTFMKASGTYTCTEATGCTSIVTADGINLGDGWTFTPAAGATLQQPDATYLRFGWWIRKDKDGPTHAGVFYSAAELTALTDAVINDAGLIGKASYTGAAAGKFAISDPLRPGEDNAGHFTANAQLEADFKATGSTLSGTIDAFRLNDGSEDPGWSVELQKTGFTSPSFATGAHS